MCFHIYLLFFTLTLTYLCQVQPLITEYLTTKLPSPNSCPAPWFDGNDRIFLLGGCDRENADKIQIFHISTETIEEVGRLPRNASFGTVLSDNSRNLFYFGSEDGQIFKYDQNSNLTNITATPYDVGYSTSIMYNDSSVLIMGGWGNERGLLLFDLELYTHTFLGNLSLDVLGAASVRVENKAYIFTSNLNFTVYEMDLQNLFLRSVGSERSIPRFANFQSVVRNERLVYIITGYANEGGGTELDQAGGIIEFNSETYTSSFHPVENFSVARDLVFALPPAAVFIPQSNRIYFFGGSSFNSTSYERGPTHDQIFFVDMSPSERFCKRCTARDSKGRDWSICVGETGVENCGIENSDGTSFWECSDSGNFLTPGPIYTSCTSRWIIEFEEIVQRLSDLDDVIEFLHDTLVEMDKNGNANYFGHEIRNITDMLRIATEKGSEFTQSVTSFEPVVDDVVKVIGKIFRLEEPWNELFVPMDRSNHATLLINQTEITSLALTEKASSNSNPFRQEFSACEFLICDTLFITSYSIPNDDSAPELDSLIFPENLSMSNSFIKLPPGWRKQVPGNIIEGIGMIVRAEYGNVMMPGQFDRLGMSSTGGGALLNGNVLGFTVASVLDSQEIDKKDRRTMIKFEGKGVEITIQHTVEAWGDGALSLRRDLKRKEKPKAAMGTAKCVYWDTDKREWSTDGCKLLSTSKWETVCECSHLTSFAVLMNLHSYVGLHRTLEALTFTLCPMSIVCLAGCIFILATLHGLQNERSTILKNLCVALLIGNLLLLIVLNSHKILNLEGKAGRTMCTIAGTSLHYVFLSAFCWMMLEGILLYRMIITVFVFDHGGIIHQVLAYGVPLVVVCITLTIGVGLDGESPYGGEVCWLKQDYRWSFLVPVIAVVLANLVILILCMLKAKEHSKRRNRSDLNSKIESFMRRVKGCITLCVLLGLTWVVGFFAMIPGAELPFSYLFVIFNASQSPESSTR